MAAMREFFRNRSRSLSFVVFVMALVAFFQGSISYSLSFGALERFLPFQHDGRLTASAWLLIRVATILFVIAAWLMRRKALLFSAIIVANVVFTVGLLVNMILLLATLVDFSSTALDALALDVILLAVTNILIFSIWYWIIDPPGVSESPRENEPWDFLFPQRGGTIPHYEEWQPRYTDYLFLAFCTSFAFSPTDTLPLSRRAKMLMLLQSTISLITLTAIAGAIVNNLAG